MKFPDWAPEVLVELYEREATARFTLHDLDLLKRLLTRLYMQTAWKEIAKRTKPPHEKDQIYRIYTCVRWAIKDAGQPQERRQVKADSYSAIAKAARDFARTVENSPCDMTPFQYFPPPAIDQLIERLRPELAEGAFCLLNPPADPHLPRDTVWYGTHLTEWPCPPFWDSGLLGFLNAMLMMSDPTMSQLADALAVRADQLAKDAMMEKVILPNPNIRNAARLYFIRRLAGFFRSQYGGYLRRTLANFASAALDEVVTVEQVNDALRHWDA